MKAPPQYIRDTMGEALFKYLDGKEVRIGGIGEEASWGR